MSTTAKLVLHVEVNYATNGVSIDTLERRLRSMVLEGIGDGALTGGTEAEMDNMCMTITRGAGDAPKAKQPDAVQNVERLVRDAVQPLAGQRITPELRANVVAATVAAIAQPKLPCPNHAFISLADDRVTWFCPDCGEQEPKA